MAIWKRAEASKANCTIAIYGSTDQLHSHKNPLKSCCAPPRLSTKQTLDTNSAARMVRIGAKFIKLFKTLFKKKKASGKPSSSTGAISTKLASKSGATNNEYVPYAYFDSTQYCLAGAVNDAVAMRGYLEKEVPSSRISCLYNEKATRRSIIHELERLIEDATIQPQDPILIFYAGHGGEKAPPRNWNIEDSLVQMIIPQDYDGDHNVITDRGMAVLLDKLASVKGDNIQSSTSDDRRLRNMPVTKPLPDDVDEDIFRAHSQEDNGPSRRLGNASHVLLAACGPKQRAYEVGGRGVFTRVLLETISTLGRKTLTYSDIIRELPHLDEQSPRCEGDNRDRFLFDPRPPIRDRSFVEVQWEEDKLVVNMGMAHGVTKSTEFVLFQEPDKNSRCLGVLTVRKVETRRSTLADPTMAITLPAYATQRKVVDVYLANHPDLAAVRNLLAREMAADSSHLQRYSFVSSKDASIRVDVEGGDVVFSYNLDGMGLARLPYRVNPTEIKTIHRAIDAACHFDRLLNLAPSNSPLETFVEISFIRLKANGYGPHIPDGECFCKDGRVEVTSGDTLYGIKITNNSMLNLYPHVFVFERRYLYWPSTVGLKDADPPLPSGGFVTIGYGTGGVAPWSHDVPDEAIRQEGKSSWDAVLAPVQQYLYPHWPGKTIFATSDWLIGVSVSVYHTDRALSQTPRLHALFIGIDRYQRVQDHLGGAVKDAQEMEAYVVQEFLSANIHSLHNEAATRGSIIGAIEKLIISSKVKRNHPILIFYAGHGSRAVPPIAWEI
ncbi:1996_t:CDS:2 [Acaulospora colombiana]|uniref:1996_t:CDS:1 n=1 Tax=Acaulospora colombiana TaxID=27376 RepID=A0ACA9MTY2_9GLOM|nr:1996_t:CDS:2 [Acaulospora colombiana]